MNKVKSENLVGVSYASVSDIESVFVDRLPTGIEELDWMYGFSERSDGETLWGIPENTISLWSGASGTGKSRAAAYLSKLLAEMGLKVLFFQGELPIQNFMGQIKADSNRHKSLFLSEEMSLDGIVSVVYDARPDVVVIDSVNQIPEFKFGGKHAADILIDGNDNHIGLRTVCNDTGAIFILLGQLNQDGSNKGGTSLSHLVDINFELFPLKDVKSDFIMRVGFKHRYGKKGTNSIWRHTKEGCSCISNNRLEDEDWRTANWVFFPAKKEVVTPNQVFNVGASDEVEIEEGDEEEWDFPQNPTFEDKMVQRACAVTAGRYDMLPQFTGAEKRKIFWNSFWTELKKPVIF